MIIFWSFLFEVWYPSELTEYISFFDNSWIVGHASTFDFVFNVGIYEALRSMCNILCCTVRFIKVFLLVKIVITKEFSSSTQ